MPIKTTSLETSKLLKQAGFRQDTYFMFDNKRALRFSSLEILNRQECSACPTTDELLEELKKCFPKIIFYNHQWHVGTHEFTESVKVFMDVNLVEALAQCWLWLKKEGLLDA